MVSLIIPTKGRPTIRRLLESISQAAHAHDLVVKRDYEVIVALDARFEFFKGVSVSDFGTSVQTVSGQGPGVNRARNAGARAASGDILWFLDDDVELRAGNFHGALGEIFSTPDRIAAGGNYRSSDEARLTERGYNAFCSLWRVSAGVEDSEQLLGGTLAVRKSEWERAGGFDESIEYGGAETSFVLRLKSEPGKKIAFDERLDVFHHSGARSLAAWQQLSHRQALQKSTTESGLPKPVVRGQRALKYLAQQDAKTVVALALFSLPYLAVSKTTSWFRS